MPSAATPSLIKRQQERPFHHITAQLEVLWDTFKNGTEARRKRARDTLLLNFSPLVRYVAHRVGQTLPASVEQSDLESYGMFGLIDAIDKFEPGRGFKFETYAISRIKGNILDELRAIDWVPRSVRAKAREIDRATQELEAKLNRSPTDAELAAEMDVDVTFIHNARSRTASSYIASWTSGPGPNPTTAGPSPSATWCRTAARIPSRTSSASATSLRCWPRP